MFEFKQFTIEDDRASMKVGTDAVLLGAWANLPEYGKVTEVGCGCGVIAMMLAQRNPRLEITALDIHRPSVEQARENVERAHMENRIEIVEADFLSWDSTCDLVISNPPYHEEMLLPPDAARSNARHTQTLPFEKLIAKSYELLTPHGSLNVVLPHTALAKFLRLAQDAKFGLTRITNVVTRPGKAPKRVLLEFQKDTEGLPFNHLHPGQIPLADECGGGRSAEYSALCADFYVR